MKNLFYVLFIDEETGCTLSDYTISSRRRWNYENNCAAIVCHVSRSVPISSTQSNFLSNDAMFEILDYTVSKLLKVKTASAKSLSPYDNQSMPSEYTNNNNMNIVSQKPAIHLKVFYQMSSPPLIEVICNAICRFREDISDHVNIAFTVIPACSLQNFSTFLSMCGIRHE